MKAIAVVAIVILIMFCVITGVIWVSGAETTEIKWLNQEIERRDERIRQLESELQSNVNEMQELMQQNAALSEQNSQQQARMEELEQENRSMKDVVSMAEEIIRQNEPKPESACRQEEPQRRQQAGIQLPLIAAAIGAAILVMVNAWLIRQAACQSAPQPDADEVWVRMTRQQAAEFARNRRRA